MIVSGCMILLVSTVGMSIFAILGWINSAHVIRSILLIMIPMSIIFLNFSLILPIALSSALVKYKSAVGTASALFGFSYYILIAVFTWFMGIIHNGTAIPMPVYFVVLSFSILGAYYFLVREV